MSNITKSRQTPTLRQLEEQGGPVEPYDKRILRSVPVQGRSRATLKSIVDAATDLLADPEVGRELMTTALVAETVGVSIGIIYRYFEDVVAIMDYVWPQRRDTVMIRWTLEGATVTAVETPSVTEPA
ncbi:MAG: helix-turn-helix domain-containing protein [Candidatus Microsaccharimonas sp.]